MATEMTVSITHEQQSCECSNGYFASGRLGVAEPGSSNELEKDSPAATVAAIFSGDETGSSAGLA
jgi:hypothetical protein